MRPPSNGLTEQELELMKIVWRRRAATVRDVYEELLKQRKIAYTTVMTMLNVLVDKGRLRKRPDDKPFVYEPTEPRRKVIGSMVGDFIGRVFDGSARPLLVQLVEDRKLSEDDLDEIRRLIRERDEEAGR